MKGLDNRNSAAYARFEEEVYILFLCNGEKLRALSCNELLVGGYYALACFKRGLNEVVGRLETADDLGYNCDLRVIEDNIEILDEFILVGAVVEITDIENILDIHFLPSLLLKAFLVLIENLYCT